MELEVKWADLAKSELANIFKYYSEVAGYRVASRIVKRIVTKADRILKHNPNIGSIETLLKDRKYEYRYLISGNYKLIYRRELSFVIVVSVLDCRRNPDNILII